MTLALGIALAVVLVVMVFWRRHLGSLMQVASLLGGLLLLIWLQDNGYLRGNGAPPLLDGSAVPQDRPR